MQRPSFSQPLPPPPPWLSLPCLPSFLPSFLPCLTAEEKKKWRSKDHRGDLTALRRRAGLRLAWRRRKRGEERDRERKKERKKKRDVIRERERESERVYIRMTSMRRAVTPPPPLPSDLVAAAVVVAASCVVLLLSLFSIACVLRLRLHAARSLRRHRLVLLGLSSLWPARLLLSLFAALWAAAELLPLLLALPRGLLPAGLAPPLICRAHALASHSLCEPCFLATLLFLLRTSTSKPQLVPANASSASAFAAALAAALASALPFLILHALCLALALVPWTQQPPFRLPFTILLGSPTTLLRGGAPRCAYPLFGTVLLAALAAAYVPLFASACWAALALVINKRLRFRLYTLAAAVVAALLAQVAALALSALWASRALAIAASVSVLTCAAAAIGILVVRPALDALAICDPLPSADIESDTVHDLKPTNGLDRTGPDGQLLGV